jgi:predicted porin
MTLAALACAAQAENITVYGRIDTNVEWVNHMPATGGSGSRLSLNSGGLSGSRWGLQGFEDLGGGMKTLFKLESGFSVDTGTLGQGGRLFGRQAWVGVVGDWGTLSFGRQYTTLFDRIEEFSIGGYPTLYEPGVQLAGPLYREDNAVKYSKTMGGWILEANYAFGEQAGTTSGGAAYGVGASYSAGPFGASIVYDDTNSVKSAAGVIAKSRRLAAAARYATGPARIFGGYRRAHLDTAAAGLPLRDDLYWLGVNYQFSPTVRLSGAYYYDKVKEVAPGKLPGNGASPKSILFIANYALSRRTDLYLSTAYARDSALNFDTLDGGATGYALVPGASSQAGLAIGIRHSF